MAKDRRVATDDGTDGIFQDDGCILSDGDRLMVKVAVIDIVGQQRGVFFQLDRMFPLIRKTIEGVAHAFIEIINIVMPFAILRLKRLPPDIFAHIVDDAASLFVSPTQLAVLANLLHIEVVFQLASLAVRQLQFADDGCKPLLLTTQAYTLGRDARNIGKEDDGCSEDEGHELVAAGAFLTEHQHEKGHQQSRHQQVEAALSEAIKPDAVDGTDPVHDEWRNGYQREVTVEPVIVTLAEYRLRRIPDQGHGDEPHHHPSNAAFRQVPLEGYLDEIGIEDGRVEDDSWRKNEIKDDPEHLKGLHHLIFVLTDERATHLWSQHKPDELEDVFVEIRGNLDAEDIEERTCDSQHRQREDASDKQAEEQLRDDMQGMGCKGAVIHLLVANNKQDACQDVGESKPDCPNEGIQVESHERQEKEEREEVNFSIDALKPEGKCDQWAEKEEDVIIDHTLHMHVFIPV